MGRGELYALLLLGRNLDHQLQVVFVTDNYNVHNIYSQGEKAAKNSANCDLHRNILQNVQYKQIQLEDRWMPSHLGHYQHDTRREGLSHFDVLANDQADKYARQAADIAQILDVVANVRISS